jgi:hypothetical protein
MGEKHRVALGGLLEIIGLSAGSQQHQEVNQISKSKILFFL